MNSVITLLLVFNIAISQTTDPETTDVNVQIDTETTAAPFEFVTCNSEPCLITPENSYTRPTYVIMTNTYEDCTVTCSDGNCKKKYQPLLILSGCNRTIIECLDKDECEAIDIRIGDNIEIPEDLADIFTPDQFLDIKDSALVSCSSLACKMASIKFSGQFRYGTFVFTAGLMALENSKIDCSSTISQCQVSCSIDDDTEKNSCYKNTLQCSTDLCGCIGACENDDIVNVLRPPEPANPNCDNGDVTISPSAGDTVICTNGCNSCAVDCKSNNCKGVKVYSGAKETTVDCSDGDKNCELLFVRVGELELDEDLPPGYKGNSFAGLKQSFLMNCDKKCACVDADVAVIGSFIGDKKVDAKELDSFQNGKLKCIGNNCELICAFDGCDGSLFDCKDDNGDNSNGCVCVDMAKEEDLSVDPQVNDGTTSQPIEEDAITTFQPDGPTCPVINSGEKSEPGVKVSPVANSNETAQKSSSGGKKIAGIVSLIVLVVIVGMLYCVVYKTRLCISGSKYETDLIKESTYNTFGNGVEMETA